MSFIKDHLIKVLNPEYTKVERVIARSMNEVTGMYFNNGESAECRNRAEILEHETDGYCISASVMLLRSLADREKALFNGMLIVQTGTFEQRAFKGRTWYVHSYFLGRDRRNWWYACSPANYQARDPNSMMQIIYSRSLDGALKAIENKEGGRWPTEKTIEKQGKTNPYFLPVNENGDLKGLIIESSFTSYGSYSETVRYAAFPPIEDIKRNWEYINYIPYKYWKDPEEVTVRGIRR